jgi:hypothetical protein
MWTKLMAGYLLISSLSASAQKTTSPAPYKFSIDLNQTFDDKLKVELIVPPIKGSSITYHLPKIVPGTYSEDDFGRYIVDFKAFDKKGVELSFTKPIFRRTPTMSSIIIASWVISTT